MKFTKIADRFKALLAGQHFMLREEKLESPGYTNVNAIKTTY
jgi:hypothetical protein